MPAQLRFSLWDHLDQSLTKQDPIPDIRIANLYPSEASICYSDANGDKVCEGACARQSWIRVKMMEHFASTRESRLILNQDTNPQVLEPKTFSPHTMWTFRLGDQVETMIKQQMMRAGVLVAEHKRFFKAIRYGYYLSGELDAVGLDPIHQEHYGVEVKSASG